MHLRLAELDRDFKQLAIWFTELEDYQNTEQGLIAYYQIEQQRIVQKVAEDNQGSLIGFFWAERNRLQQDKVAITLYVIPEMRMQGVGSKLYSELLEALSPVPVNCMRVSVWDNCPEGRLFAERLGYTEKLHQIAMILDLTTFDDRKYENIISGLQDQGFLFTSMAALGNTEEAQQKLYILNDATSRDVPGNDGEAHWDSFEDFQKRVCQSDWYKPEGQMVAVDTHTGTWAAMSAITRFPGAESAYNLHTGVAKPYRGRGLAQAVKVIALRFARKVLEVDSVRTHHNTLNTPMLAIDRKLGYIQQPGTFLMEKHLD